MVFAMHMMSVRLTLCLEAFTRLSIFDRHNNMTVDRFLMVYDMRVMRAMAPIQVIIDPMFLRFIPTYNNRMAIVSQVQYGLHVNLQSALLGRKMG